MDHTTWSYMRRFRHSTQLKFVEFSQHLDITTRTEYKGCIIYTHSRWRNRAFRGAFSACERFCLPCFAADQISYVCRRSSTPYTHHRHIFHLSIHHRYRFSSATCPQLSCLAQRLVIMQAYISSNCRKRKPDRLFSSVLDIKTAMELITVCEEQTAFNFVKTYVNRKSVAKPSVSQPRHIHLIRNVRTQNTHD